MFIVKNESHSGFSRFLIFSEKYLFSGISPSLCRGNMAICALSVRIGSSYNTDQFRAVEAYTVRMTELIESIRAAGERREQ